MLNNPRKTLRQKDNNEQHHEQLRKHENKKTTMSMGHCEHTTMRL